MAGLATKYDAGQFPTPQLGLASIEAYMGGS